MTGFNVQRRYFLNISADDGPTVSVQLEVSTEGELRIAAVGHLRENESLYLYLGKTRRRA